MPGLRYLMLVMEGASDVASDALDGKTPLEAAKTPQLDRLCETGRVGRVRLHPEAGEADPAQAVMSLLGYPAEAYPGRGVLDALGAGVALQAGDTVMRVDLLQATDGRLALASVPMSDAEADALLETVWGGSEAELLPGASLYRLPGSASLAVDGSGRDWSEVVAVAPTTVVGQSIRKHLPAGGDQAELLHGLVAASQAALPGHEVNQTREEFGEPPATHVWPWGIGRLGESVMPLPDRVGMPVTVLTDQAWMAGLAGYVGVTEVREVEPGLVDQAAETLAPDRLVVLHLSEAATAGLAGNVTAKVEAIERLDAEVVGPLAERLFEAPASARLLVACPGATLADRALHDAMPTPFLVSGYRAHAVLRRQLNEPAAEASDLQVGYGHELLEFFLASGLRH